MEFEPIWWATIHSRRKPNRRLSNTPAITIPEALAIRPVTFEEGIWKRVPPFAVNQPAAAGSIENRQFQPWRRLAGLRVPRPLCLGKGEALPAIPTAGHLWAQQDSFQGGTPRTAVFRAAANGTAAQSTVRVIYDSYLLGNFRLGALFGHLWSPSLLRRAGYTCRGLPHFQWVRIFLTTPRVGEAQPALLAAGQPWAQ